VDVSGGIVFGAAGETMREGAWSSEWALREAT
jgi:hypothetical protein